MLPSDSRRRGNSLTSSAGGQAAAAAPAHPSEGCPDTSEGMGKGAEGSCPCHPNLLAARNNHTSHSIQTPALFSDSDRLISYVPFLDTSLICLAFAAEIPDRSKSDIPDNDTVKLMGFQQIKAAVPSPFRILIHSLTASLQLAPDGRTLLFHFTLFYEIVDSPNLNGHSCFGGQILIFCFDN